MLVKDFCTDDVRTVEDSADAHEVAEVMAHHAVGSLVVVDDHGRAVGVVTDRDLALRAVGLAGPTPHEIPLEQLMSTPLASTAPDTPLEDAIKEMRSRGVRRMPVCQEGRPVGMLAVDDVLEVLSRALFDLGAESALRGRQSRRRARYERARHEVEDFFEDVHDRLAYARWYTQEAFLDELDEIRERLKGFLKGPD